MNKAKKKGLLVLITIAMMISGCEFKYLKNSTYVLIRYSNLTGEPAFRGYFMDEDESLNLTDCKEIMTLANEAVEVRKSNGEINLTEYKCVPLKEARRLGFN